MSLRLALKRRMKKRSMWKVNPPGTDTTKILKNFKINCFPLKKRCISTLPTHITSIYCHRNQVAKLRQSLTEGTGNIFSSTDLNSCFCTVSLGNAASTYVLIQARNKTPIDSSTSKTGLERCTE